MLKTDSEFDEFLKDPKNNAISFEDVTDEFKQFLRNRADEAEEYSKNGLSDEIVRNNENLKTIISTIKGMDDGRISELFKKDYAEEDRKSIIEQRRNIYRIAKEEFEKWKKTKS